MENQMNRSNLVNFFSQLNNDIKFEMFCIAILQNNREMCQILLDSGFDINFCSPKDVPFCNAKRDDTVLTFLTKNGKEDVVEMARWLIERGADKSQKVLPLLLACDANNLELVNLYLENGAKVTKKTIMSAMKPHIKIDILKELLKSLEGKSNNISWLDIYDSVDYNIRIFEKVKLLFAFGIGPTDMQIFQCLQGLVENGAIEAVEYLLENYFESGCVDYRISSFYRGDKHAIVYLCDIAVQNEDRDMLKLLKKYGLRESTTKEKAKELLYQLREVSKQDAVTRTELENEFLALITKK